MVSVMVKNIKKAQKNVLTLSFQQIISVWPQTSQPQTGSVSTSHIYCKGTWSLTNQNPHQVIRWSCSVQFITFFFYNRSASWTTHVVAPGWPCQVGPPLIWCTPVPMPFFNGEKKKSIWMFSALASQETPFLCSSVWDHSLISVSHSHSHSLSRIGLQKITGKLQSVDLLMPKAKGHANPRLFCQMVCARLFLWNACLRVTKDGESSACISTGPIALYSNADSPLPHL